MSEHPSGRGLTVDDWLRIGWERGFCAPPACVAHDGLPTTAEEDDDPDCCVMVVRLYESGQEAMEVSENCPELAGLVKNLGWNISTNRKNL